MAQYREYTIAVFMSDTDILITSKIGGYQVSNRIARDGSEDANFAAAMVAHKALAFSRSANTTSPPCSVESLGKWVKFAPSGAVTGLATIIHVPPGNSGQLDFSLDTGGGSMTYSVNGATPVAATDGGNVTVVEGDTLKFAASGLAAQESATGSVIDHDTGLPLDTISLYNSTPAP